MILKAIRGAQGTCFAVSLTRRRWKRRGDLAGTVDKGELSQACGIHEQANPHATPRVAKLQLGHLVLTSQEKA